MFGSMIKRPSANLVDNIEAVKPFLSSSGWSFEHREPVEILGMTMEVVRLRRSGRISAVGFGGGFLHLIQLVRLQRPIEIAELLRFNSTTQMFNLTSSREPLGAILKAHVPAQFGLPSEMVASLLNFLDDGVDEVISLVGPENVRA